MESGHMQVIVGSHEIVQSDELFEDCDTFLRHNLKILFTRKFWQIKIDYLGCQS